jgi:uncharacterized membrane protein (UPF0127 family)
VSFLSEMVRAPAARYAIRSSSGVLLATGVESAFDSASRRRGLLGRVSLPRGGAMILAPCSAVHTCFMAFPIDLLFVARDGCVLKICLGVKPWRLAWALRAFATIELPAGALDGVLARGDRLHVAPSESP